MKNLEGRISAKDFSDHRNGLPNLRFSHREGTEET
jgi:hypothetical protein